MRERIKAKLYFCSWNRRLRQRLEYLGTFEVVGGVKNDYQGCELRVVHGRRAERCFESNYPMRMLFLIENNPYFCVKVISRRALPTEE